jgi:TonB family protein
MEELWTPITSMSDRNAQEFSMNKTCFDSPPTGVRRKGARIFQAAALLLLIVLAIPARAADERAIKSRVPPVYPEIARRMKISGEVRIQATVDADGKVIDTKPISGNRVLSQAAEDAVRRWKFEPGAGVSTVVVSVNFGLE